MWRRSERAMQAAGWSRRRFLSPEREGRGAAAWLDAVPSQPATQQVTISRRAMACTFSVTFPAEQRRAVDAGCAALDEIERLEEKLSAYRDDSDISRINRWAWKGPVAVDQEVFTVCQMSARLTQATEGAFDIAAGALSKAWGFYRGPKRVPAEEELRAALAASGMANVELDAVSRAVRFRRPGVEFNLGSIGKGDRPGPGADPGRIRDGERPHAGRAEQLESRRLASGRGARLDRGDRGSLPARAHRCAGQAEGSRPRNVRRGASVLHRGRTPVRARSGSADRLAGGSGGQRLGDRRDCG